MINEVMSLDRQHVHLTSLNKNTDESDQDSSLTLNRPHPHSNLSSESIFPEARVYFRPITKDTPDSYCYDSPIPRSKELSEDDHDVNPKQSVFYSRLKSPPSTPRKRKQKVVSLSEFDIFTLSVPELLESTSDQENQSSRGNSRSRASRFRIDLPPRPRRYDEDNDGLVARLHSPTRRASAA
ncbi:predicted protein [Chaetoceros tenuissimus]|uniref:Uncharacterized protein n=1 Tax=Chaetoceros tenuissimus TaxID=426638 RepID=A0AAD3GZ04_9STRA|nr:predicted protein [Chaetoceros tenuissimus]